MKVLLTTPTYPPFNSGLGNAVRRHALGLVRHGFEVVVATGGSARTTEMMDGVRVERFAVTGADYLRNPIRGDVESYRSFLRTERYDTIVLEAWQTWSTDIPLQISGELKARKFLYSHCLSTNSWLSYIPVRSLAFYILWRPYWWTLRKKIASLDAMIFLADGGSDDRFDDLGIARKVGVPIHVIPNSCDTAALATPSDTRTQIISVGSYTPAKGFDYVIAAYARSRAKNVIPLALFGQEHTAFTNVLRAQAQDLGVTPDMVSFNSGVAGEALLAKYAQSRLFLSGSHTECQPLVLLDAMATGTPFVARSTGCIANMPGGDAAISVNEAAEAIDRLLEDDAAWAQYQTDGLRAAEQTYNYERNSAHLAAVLSEDLERARRLP
ncbi:glycosyltransferase family 4 protein [Devosia sp.]|uniref:glycosyltransferase family 4 protein n=1 Tax=Devosia sp. TaxID=1871048 RepID=UPI001ACB1D38|nr:glycosyltransferase family 4 protein [Devosia sp.]MBN9332131.1 glycosyltransferase family 4 protein [Devosia sp.]